MSKFTQRLCILFAFLSLVSNATGSRPHPALHALAPEKPPSCDGLKLKMHACSPYFRKDSSMAEPGTSCCLGLMDAWKDNSDCSDEVLKSIVNLRHVNETRVTHVSSACGFSDSFLDKYLASLLEARLEEAEAEQVESELDEAMQAVSNQAVADQAKMDKAEADKAKAYKAMRVAVAVAGVAVVIVIAAIILALCSRYF